jgi:hypothetical protein
LKYYDGYQRGKIKHASLGDNTAQWSKKWLGDLEQNHKQTVSLTLRKPGQYNPQDNSQGKHLTQKPDKG